MNPSRGHALTAYHAPLTTTMNYNMTVYKQGGNTE